MKRLLLTTTAFCFAVLPAFADPVTAAVAALGAASATAATFFGLTTAASIAAFSFTATFFTNFAIIGGLSLLSRALMPKPNRTIPISGYEVAGVSAAADHAIIYGETRVGGVVVYKETTPSSSNKYLHLVIAVAGHEVESFEKIYFDDEEVTLDGDNFVTSSNYFGYDFSQAQEGNPSNITTIPKARIITHLGTADQEADTTLSAESAGKWTADHRLQGIAYVYVRLEYDQDAWPNGEPAISFLVQGKKLYNSNTDTTEYSTNPAWALRDYLVSDYGLNVSTDEIDEASFATAASICDEDVDVAAGTEKRYTINGTFTTGSKPNEIIDALVNSMAGTIWYSAGKWRVKAGAYTSPVLSLNEDDLRGNISITTRASRRDNFNIVRGTFKGAETNYQKTDFPQIRSQTFIDVDGGQESAIDIELPFTSTSSMAQRIAKIALYRAREQITVTAAFGMRAFQLQVGDIIQLTNTRAGWTDKTFEVANWAFAPDAEQGLIVSMTLREISSTVFDWSVDDEQALEFNNTTLANPFTKPRIGINHSLSSQIVNEHITNVLTLTVSSNQPERVDYVIVEFKKSSESKYKKMGVGELGDFQVIDIEDGTYDFRVRAVTVLGIRSDYETLTAQIIETPKRDPQDVSNFSGALSDGVVNLTWAASTDPDLSHYKIRHTRDEDLSAGDLLTIWADSVVIVDKVARPATSVQVPALGGTYMIRAYNKQNRPSLNYSYFTLPEESLRDFANSDTENEHTAFSGTKTDVKVDSNNLYLDAASLPLVVVDAANKGTVVWPVVYVAMADIISGSLTSGDLYDILTADVSGYDAGDIDQSTVIDLLDIIELIGYVGGDNTYANLIETYIRDPILAAYDAGEGWVTTANWDDVTEGTYEFSNTTAFVSDRHYRTRILIDVQRATGVFADIGSGDQLLNPFPSDVWDGIQGNWDGWVGNWDNWDDGSSTRYQDNIDVEIYVNPEDSGGTALGWRKFNSVDLYGTDATYKLVLKSNMFGATPKISFVQKLLEWD